MADEYTPEEIQKEMEQMLTNEEHLIMFAFNGDDTSMAGKQVSEKHILLAVVYLFNELSDPAKAYFLMKLLGKLNKGATDGATIH